MSDFTINGASPTSFPPAVELPAREKLGVNGAGRVIYAESSSYLFTWGVLPDAEFAVLYNLISALNGDRAVFTVPVTSSSGWLARSGNLSIPTGTREYAGHVTNVRVEATLVRAP